MAAVILLLIALGTLVAVYTLPDRLVPADQLEAEARLSLVSDERRNAIAVGAAIGAAFSLWLALGRHQLNRDANRTDRYSAAVPMLVHESLEVRLGGIYALERLLADSSRDAPTVAQVLAAFVRERAAPRGDEMPHDVRAAIETLARVKDKPGGRQLDLVGVNLSRADLSGAHLRRARFDGGDLSGAVFIGADLRGASFRDANLAGADFTDARLEDAVLYGVHAEGTVFRRARLVAAMLDQITLERTDFSRARAARACFAYANGQADFRGADLRGASFDKADLRSSEMAGARLQGANLRLALLGAVRGLVGSQLRRASLDNTQLPDGLRDAQV